MKVFGVREKSKYAIYVSRTMYYELRLVKSELEKILGRRVSWNEFFSTFLHMMRNAIKKQEVKESD